MKEISFFFIFLRLIKFSISVIPLWNFESSAYNLLSDTSEHSYIIYEGNIWGKYIKLEKHISKNDNSIIEQNYITIDDFRTQTNWENIESYYVILNNVYICPKGKNHMNLFENNIFNETIPPGFSLNEEWELKCYYQMNEQNMFIAYLNKVKILYYYNFRKNEFNCQIVMHNLLYDFIWTTDKISD